MKTPLRKFRGILLFWTLFIGLGAVAGATGMLADPSGRAMGMDAMLPYFQVLPFADRLFQDFVFSGIMLLTVNGLTNLLAALLLILKKRLGILLGMIFGITLMLWICIQFYIFPLNFMSTIYFIFGLFQAVTGYAAWVFARQEEFVLPEPVPVTDEKHLVIYFSRMGYTEKAAMEAAPGAVFYELKASEPTSGIGGFWWCGFCGLRRREMPIEPVGLDLKQYEHVTLCASIWVFSLCGPMRRFCREAAGSIKSADYILLHHTPGKYAHAADEMDRLLGIRRKKYTSICCKMGRFVRKEEMP